MADEEDARHLEDYVMLILSDSNLPTGGFIASAGLESYYSHGFMTYDQKPGVPTQQTLTERSVDFVEFSLGNYVTSVLPYIHAAQLIAVRYLDSVAPGPNRAKKYVTKQAAPEKAAPLKAKSVTARYYFSRRPNALTMLPQSTSEMDVGTEARKEPLASKPIPEQPPTLDETLKALAALDWHHHTLLLNHVSRRASMIQGIALLSLFARSFAQPAPIAGEHALDPRAEAARVLIERLRKNIRRGSAKLNNGAMSLFPGDGEMAGHLPICAGVFGLAAGLSIDRALHLNLFLQARNLMSCSIRLNTLGPYMAHQLLSFQLRDIVQRQMNSLDREAGARLYAYAIQASLSSGSNPDPPQENLEQQTWDWDWPEEDATFDTVHYPFTSWPLGEVIQARHDQLHSRLFNS
ncbi:hypothetical protein MVES1_000103 [Malassezia vespertilionis]|uniref:Uncharacterized protein n=1 Tax=Malassezia vespertilionis TaxID=2020962 RepID=A0A2N1JG74_9BASI|nr:uncharacterized protein MVES1_000103 [Malassezia vespertilionis]PKI85543.1 hypothetical protein MVES_000103 [Malassezia vespertilionis]WFD04779.1 hypothetical protein MVES1_000103 [Malassezia vespertilionis]